MTVSKWTLTAFVIFIGAVLTFFGTKALSQVLVDHQHKKLTRPDEKVEPLEIVEAKADGERVPFDSSFDREGDWLKDFSVTYRNKTGRTIVSMTVLLLFPETKGPNGIETFPISFGTPRMAALAGDRSTVIKPGDLLTVTMTPTNYDRMKKFVETKQSLRSISEVEVQVTFILFDDGTAWAGQYRIPDPQKPNRWMVDPKQVVKP